MEQLHGLGWIPDIPSHLDYTEDHPLIAPLLQRTGLAPRVVGHAGRADRRNYRSLPPPAKDLRPLFSPVEDQGHLGSCTANAAIALLEYFEKRRAAASTSMPRACFSTRSSASCWDGPAIPGRSCARRCRRWCMFGAPPEKYWPYDGSLRAATAFRRRAARVLLRARARITGHRVFPARPERRHAESVLANIKSYLAKGFPSMFGFPVYPEYDNLLPGGLVAFPGPASRQRGGHANVGGGYDDTKQIGDDVGALLVRNSWGPPGGPADTHGCRIGTSPGLATDWWTMISAEWVDDGAFD